LFKFDWENDRPTQKGGTRQYLLGFFGLLVAVPAAARDRRACALSVEPLSVRPNQIGDAEVA
jgi:hypothetical protein